MNGKRLLLYSASNDHTPFSPIDTINSQIYEYINDFTNEPGE